MKHIFKCGNCGKYTMKEVCGCGQKTLIARHVRYTPNDKFASYKRKAKIDEYTSRGLI